MCELYLLLSTLIYSRFWAVSTRKQCCLCERERERERERFQFDHFIIHANRYIDRVIESGQSVSQQRIEEAKMIEKEHKKIIRWNPTS
jgi:hypothetical protein